MATTMVHVSLDGVSLDIPDTWDSTTFEDKNQAPYLLVASSTVTADDGALGYVSQESMGADDVLIDVSEAVGVTDASASSYQPITGAPQISRSDIGSYSVPAPAVVNQFYKMNGRYFQIVVAFGQEDPTDAQIATANDVLSTLTVEPNPAGNG